MKPPPVKPPKTAGETEKLPGGGDAAAAQTTAGGSVPSSTSPVDPNTSLEPPAPGGVPMKEVSKAHKR